jgi:EthD domain
MFAALLSTDSGAVAVARSINGSALLANAGEVDPPYRALIIGDDRDALAAVGDHGLYEVTVRRQRHQRRFWPVGDPTPGVTAAFAQWRPRDMTHEEADQHWATVHARLALRHHPGVWQYHQVNITKVLSGTFYDGIALLSFASEQEQAERFFFDDEGRDIIIADTPNFVDPTHLPQTVTMTEWRFYEDSE